MLAAIVGSAETVPAMRSIVGAPGVVAGGLWQHDGLLGYRSAVSIKGDPGDSTLLAQLDTTVDRADAWNQLLAAADGFAGLPHAAEDVRWEQPDGTFTIGYPIYGERVERACEALAEVGAVTPLYRWMEQPAPTVPDTGAPLTPADAIRLATAIIRGERFGDGTIGEAVRKGALQAVLASLSTWYRSRG